MTKPFSICFDFFRGKYFRFSFELFVGFARERTVAVFRLCCQICNWIVRLGITLVLYFLFSPRNVKFPVLGTWHHYPSTHLYKFFKSFWALHKLSTLGRIGVVIHFNASTNTMHQTNSVSKNWNQASRKWTFGHLIETKQCHTNDD